MTLSHSDFLALPPLARLSYLAQRRATQGHDCPECLGVGFYSAPWTTPNGVKTDRVIACPKCKGTKKA